MNLLSVQSHVAYGHVGNAAAVFPLQRLGIEVWPIHTVQFSNHTGYGSWKGRVFEADVIRELMQGIDERKVLSECDGVISGYMGSADIGEAILESVARVKRANPSAHYCCDPVIGDVGRGVFVRPGIPEFMKTRAVPAADFITPNQFELEILAGREVKTLADAREAVKAVHDLGPRVILVTSLHTSDTPEDSIDLLASDPLGMVRVRTPKLPIPVNGAGHAHAQAADLRERCRRRHRRLVLHPCATHRLRGGGAYACGLRDLRHLALYGGDRRSRDPARRGTGRNSAAEPALRSRSGLKLHQRDRSVQSADSVGVAHAAGASSRQPRHEDRMRRRFVTLDVFTEKRFAGNPLAVVLESDGLSTDGMQSIAREFNHPETVFVAPPEDSAHRAKLRIFTPGAELTFAGHPTVGTAVLLNRLDGGKAGDIVIEEKIGLLRCRVGGTGADSGRATFVIPQLPAEAGVLPKLADIAAALSTEVADIGFDGYTPQRWSSGNAFTMVPLRSLAAMAKVKPNLATYDATFGRDGRALAYVFCAETAEQGHHFHTRMFAPKLGIAEDPATGSAAAAFPGLLAAQGPYKDGDHAVLIEQGYEMGRPSLIELAFSIRAGALTSASVGGSAVVVTEGVIEA